MQLSTDDIHVWIIDLTITQQQAKINLALLSSEEKLRAQRFYSHIHQQRFIAAHSACRKILSSYLDIAPAQINFAYTKYRKPYLVQPKNFALEFNLAHSKDLAMLAIRRLYAIGIDIEQIQPTYKQAIANRYFSTTENQALLQLPEAMRVQAFYRIWSRKEAVIKAIGKGLSLPLNSFNVEIQAEDASIIIDNTTWYISALAIHHGYQAALATNYPIYNIAYWLYDENLLN